MGTRTIEGTVLITGASGFIGGRLRDALLDAGADVVALRRAGSPEPRRGRSAVVDYSDKDALRRLVEKERPEFVYHVAGATKGVTYADFQRANVMPTENLTFALRDAFPDVRRFVLFSSLGAYGPSSSTVRASSRRSRRSRPWGTRSHGPSSGPPASTGPATSTTSSCSSRSRGASTCSSATRAAGSPRCTWTTSCAPPSTPPTRTRPAARATSCATGCP